MRIRSSIAVLALTAFTVSCAPDGIVAPEAADVPVSSAMDATTLTINDVVGVAIGAFVPCAAGGAGEVVIATGNLHVLIHLTIDAAGGFNLVQHFQPMGLKGTGLTTGNRYNAVGKTIFHDTGHGATTFTFVNTFAFIGQGAGNNLRVVQNGHTTINANGEVTTVVDNSTITCT